MNIRENVYWGACIFSFRVLDIYPGVQVLDSMVALFLVCFFFSGNPILFYTVAILNLCCVLVWFWYQSSNGPHRINLRVFCLLQFLDWHKKDRCQLFTCLVEFSHEVIWSWIFVCWAFKLQNQFHYYWSVYSDSPFLPDSAFVRLHVFRNLSIFF